MAIGLAVLAGLFVGVGLGDGFGALAGALLGWLCVRSVQQGREIDRLRQALGDMPRASTPASAPLHPAALPAPAPAAVMPAPRPPPWKRQSSPTAPPGPRPRRRARCCRRLPGATRR